MFIKRAKSRPSLRARDTDEGHASSPLAKSTFTAEDAGKEDEGDEGGNNGGEASFGGVMERKKAQKGKKDKRLAGVKTGGTRLSFGGEDEEASASSLAGPSAPRKSGLGRQVLSSSISASPSPTSASNYSSEYLAQLKASTPSRASRNADGDEGIESNEGNGLSNLARQKYASQFTEDTTAGIPDAAAVASARMKRQAAVENAKHGNDLGEDYIALGGGKVIIRDAGTSSGPHPESRLMREEDEDDEGDEDLADYTESKNRLYIGKQANKDASRRLRGEIGEMIADREADEESDEETREWELAQSRRAGGGMDDAVNDGKIVASKHTPASIPRIRPAPSIAPAQARILAAIAESREVTATGEHDLDVVSQELAALQVQEADLRREVELVEVKREWVDEFRGWVEMLGAFLEEKYPKLEVIEKESFAHMAERASLISKRRQLDDLDDLALCIGVAPAEDKDAVAVEVDELGRARRGTLEEGPSSAIRKARRAERLVRREKRKSRPAASSALTPSGDDEGFSTDSTMADGDAHDYSSAHTELGKRVESLLDDVKAEDFRDPSKGLAIRFGDWRRRYEDEYVGAFGGLSMVQAWSFWARGEMMGWEPLRTNRRLEEFQWFEALHRYSFLRLPPRGRDHTKMEVDDEDEDEVMGPDGDLNKQMCNDAVVPILVSSFSNGAYDPYSAKQTRKAVDLIEIVQDLAGKESRKFSDVLQAVLFVFSQHITTLSLDVSACSLPTATPAPDFDPAARPAAQRFIRRRIKLLRNLLLWRRLAQGEIRDLIGRVVRELVLPVLSKAWDSGGKELAGQVLMASGGLLSGELVSALQRGPGGR